MRQWQQSAKPIRHRPIRAKREFQLHEADNEISKLHSANKADDNDDGKSDKSDDYMNLTIIEEQPVTCESSLQRRIRTKREAEKNGMVKSKKELEREQIDKLQHGLSTSITTLDPSNKGYRIMAKLGFTPGTTLGKQGKGLKEPLKLNFHENRIGLGSVTHGKRKFEDDLNYVQTQGASGDDARIGSINEISVESYRKRVTLEREEKRIEMQILAAQKLAERLTLEKMDQIPNPPDSTIEDYSTISKANDNKICSGIANTHDALFAKLKESHKISQYHGIAYQDIPTEWRILVYHDTLKAITDYEHRMISQYLPRAECSQAGHAKSRTYLKINNNCADQDSLNVDTMLRESEEHSNYDGTYGLRDDLALALEKDEELSEFNTKPATERLKSVLCHLRSSFKYCFWCKQAYETSELSGCPGVNEEDHE